MVDKENIDTINELKIWIAGQLDIATHARERIEEDMRAVRQRTHDLSGEITKLVAELHTLNFASLKELVIKHDAELDKYTEERAERKGAIRALKAAYAIGGALSGILASLATAIATGHIRL